MANCISDSPPRTRVLASELEAAGAGSSARDLEAISEERYQSSDMYRAALVATQAMARYAVEQGLGLLHGQELRSEGSGEWTYGIFRHAR